MTRDYGSREIAPVVDQEITVRTVAPDRDRLASCTQAVQPARGGERALPGRYALRVSLRSFCELLENAGICWLRQNEKPL